MRASRLATLLLLAALPARAHDVLVEVGPSFTTGSPDDPRTGSLQARAEGTLEASDAWDVFLSAQYTRDFATRIQGESSSGSDVFLLGLGTSWAPDEHWLATLAVSGGPPSHQRNATLVTDRLSNVTTDAIVDSRVWTVGGLLLVAYRTGHEADLESTFDASGGVTRFDVFQQLELSDSAAARQFRTGCLAHPRLLRCRLLQGVATPLVQGRLGLGYTLSVGQDTDLGVAVDGYLYDGDPDAVGFFSLAAVGRTELGTGVPLLPLALSVRPSWVQRLGPVTLRVAYQLGLYVNGRGSNHALTAKVTWRTSELVRLWLSATAQVDATQGALNDPGGSALAGVLLDF